MDTLIFASNNTHKADEIRSVLNGNLHIITLKEAGININIPEPFSSLVENANGKAQMIFELTGKNCFSEDTGLLVDALNGEPGVKSARYAGENASYADNTAKLLENLAEHTNRTARFITIISLIVDGRMYNFEGVCPGRIAFETKGSGGFGYDAVFVPDGSERTFAEMDMTEKNHFSHRKKAIDKLVAFLSIYTWQE